ncbi:Type II secretory pathway, component HofQ [Thiorhodovibrio winogradskyi]|uniref:Type II secretory pathway, component HofQ n=1 Tax=Thiorhodovibrio winogradskyi TaxID=77007 RepID=A0ABZ0S9R5_9GAMM|nr:secretin N-terminal domain-containing protein [Thiorhodovibrio winogradskyi]
MKPRISYPSRSLWPGPLRLCLGLLMMAFILPAAIAADGRDFAYLPVYSQPAEDLVAVLRPMAGGGSVLAHRNQIIVRGTPEEIAAVSEALERLDQPARRLMIEVRLADRSAGQRGGRYLDGGWERGDGQDSVSIHAGTREIRTRRRDDSVQRVQTLDGRPALIRTGLWRPVTTFAGVDPYSGGVVLGQGVQSIDTGFQVLPRTHGDQVTLELYQQDEQALPNGRLRGGSAQTVLRGYLGEWLDIGGQQQLEATNGRRWTTGHAEERHLQVRVRPLD